MYLGTRLNKFDISDWQGKIPGSKQKWWECFVEDLSVELMEGGFAIKCDDHNENLPMQL